MTRPVQLLNGVVVRDSASVSEAGRVVEVEADENGDAVQAQMRPTRAPHASARSRWWTARRPSPAAGSCSATS